MNQCTNARAASLEQCKRMLATPHSLPFLFDLIPLILLIESLFFPPTLSFALLVSHICRHCFAHIHFPLTNLFLSFILLFNHPSPVLPSYLFSPFSVRALLHWARRVYRFYFLPFCSCSSFPELFLTLCPLIVFKEWKREKKREKVDEDRGEKGGQHTKKRGRRVKEERLKAHYFPTDGRKWVRGQ